MLKNNFTLHEHKIGKLISDDVSFIAKESIKKKAEKTIELDSKFYYVSQLMYPCFEIENKFEDFQQAYLLLSKYPKGKKYQKNFTRENYIIYHLQFYMISQVALFDRLLHLTNFVFELGLDDLNVKYSIIINNSRVPKSCKSIIKDFDNFLSKNNIRAVQNKIKHKERLKDSKLYTASLFEWSSKIKGNLPQEDLDDMNKTAMGMYKIYILIKRNMMKSEVEKMNNMTHKWLDSLYPEILKKYQSF